MSVYIEAPRQIGTPVCIAFPGESPRGGYVIVDASAERATVSRRGAVSSTIVPWSWVVVRKY